MTRAGFVAAVVGGALALSAGAAAGAPTGGGATVSVSPAQRLQGDVIVRASVRRSGRTLVYVTAGIFAAPAAGRPARTVTQTSFVLRPGQAARSILLRARCAPSRTAPVYFGVIRANVVRAGRIVARIGAESSTSRRYACVAR